jgi:signal transduction histidine kinase/ActR/RegA family two-component response regulator
MLSWGNPAAWKDYAAALLIIGLASALRAVVFADLGRSTTYLTYYPAVVIAAFIGGLIPGLLATVLSAFLCFYWIQAGHMSPVESMAMGTFIISCTMISVLAESRRRSEIRARQEKERAEAANVAKSVFLARMSHELRTPMNAILGFSEILRRDTGLSAEQQRSLEIINRSGGHLLSLINDVLDMAKIDAGRMELTNTAFDLIETARDVAELMRARAEARQLRLVLDQSPDLPRYIRADAAKLRQTMLNLIGNAIKFTERGGIAVRLSMLPGDSTRPMSLVIEVEDSGIGIKAADLDRIFDPFIQGDTPALQKGTGLGLAITRKFLDLMGGRISVRSTPGQGSTFRVEMPVELADASESAAPEKHDRIVGLAPGQPECRILVVEDQIENWLLLQQLLEPLGFKVRIAEDGQAGVAAFQEWHPQLIFMDILMPVMDGLEATKRIRQLDGGEAVKIVAITASVFKDEADKVIAAGIDGLIRKPYHRDELLETLQRSLGVSLIHDQPATATTDPGPVRTLAPAAFAGLPENLCSELGEALVTLDVAQIGAVIARIAEADPALGRTLAHSADQLDYSAILLALPSATGNAAQKRNTS